MPQGVINTQQLSEAFASMTKRQRRQFFKTGIYPVPETPAGTEVLPPSGGTNGTNGAPQYQTTIVTPETPDDSAMTMAEKFSAFFQTNKRAILIVGVAIGALFLWRYLKTR